jgi:hypothetical protein
MGRKKTRARKIHVFKPPPQLHVMYPGMPTSRPMRKVLLNDSRPEPSAGRGALAMVGYCLWPCISVLALQSRAQWLAGFAEIYCLQTHRSRLHSAIELWLDGRWRRRRLDPLEVLLRRIAAHIAPCWGVLQDAEQRCWIFGGRAVSLSEAKAGDLV